MKELGLDLVLLQKLVLVLLLHLMLMLMLITGLKAGERLDIHRLVLEAVTSAKNLCLCLGLMLKLENGT